MTFLQPITNRLSTLPPEWLIIICLTAVTFTIIWLLLNTFFIIKNHSWMKRLFGNTQKEDIKEILQEHIERVGVVQIKLNDLENLFTNLQKSSLKHVQKLGIIRFNPFDDTGSNQSFALAILDAENNGFVISALHGREKTRMYAKPVKNGKPDAYPFSKEEEDAIKQALQI